MNILGLDIGRNGAVGIILSEFPRNPQKEFRKLRKDFLRLKPDAKAIALLDSLAIDGLVLEPTGTWYSRIWKVWAESRNIPIYWVGHADLSHQRGSYGFSNKRDDEDAFCLACTYFDERFIDSLDRPRFLNFSPEVEELRSLVLELEQVDKLKTSFINQTRQRLCHEFPEYAEKRIGVSKKLGFSPFWGWLAGQHTYPRIINAYSKSIAPGLGIEISSYTRRHAAAIVDLEIREHELTQQAQAILQRPEFAPYLKAFKKFAFGIRNQSILLAHIYPIDQWLVGGRRWIEREWRETEAHPEGVESKRDRSLRAFQAYLGMSYSLKQSGDTLKKSFHGSDLVRAHLYMWAVTKIRSSEGKVAIGSRIAGRKLSPKIADLQAQGVKGSDKVIRFLFKVTRELFAELVRECK